MKILDTIRSEPIRAILYPVLGVVVAVLVAKGVITQFSADTIIAIIGAVLGVPVAAEIARLKVTPVAKLTGGEDAGGAGMAAGN